MLIENNVLFSKMKMYQDVKLAKYKNLLRKFCEYGPCPLQAPLALLAVKMCALVKSDIPTAKKLFQNCHLEIICVRWDKS